MISFRPANLATDAPWLAHLLSLTTPEPLTIEQVRERWQPAEGEARFTNVALNDQGQTVGMAGVAHEAWMKPGHVRLTLVVAPEWRNQGIGTRLFAEGIRFAQAQGASRLESAVRDDAPEALCFAEQRGYRVDRHSFESALDLTSFDERPFVSALERARAAGLRFFSLADLAPVTEQLERRL
jgi:GNAT superfamily N-acetyltransferase